jgi:putative membrane protein
MRLINALLIAVPATALMTVPAVSQTSGDHRHMMGAWGWGGMIFGPIMMIVFLAVVVVVVVLLVRWLGGPGHGGALHSPPGKTPLDILKERFAKGEIDKEEFEERRRVLGE